MDKLLCMRAFKEVVEAKGFSNAARRAGFSKALLSKYVAQLEESLGARLLQRTTRKVSLTEIGQVYYSRCVSLLDNFDELEDIVKDVHTTPSGELKVSAPTNFSELHLIPVLTEFSKRFPDIQIKLQLTDDVVDIVEQGVDLALRIGVLPDSSLVAYRLATVEHLICASPEYLNVYGEPKQPEDLLKHACIVDDNYRNGQSWQFNDAGGLQNMKVQGRHSVNSAVAVKELAVRGNGIALCPSFAVTEEIKSGQLKVILATYKMPTMGLYVVYSHRKNLSKKTQLFIDLLKDYFNDTRL